MTDISVHSESAGMPQEPFNRADMHVPGAGTLTMYLLVVALSVLFLASIAAFVIVRIMTQAQTGWPPPGFPAMPRTLWLSTIVILACSGAMHWALVCIRRDRPRILVRALAVTFALAILFMILQCVNWWEIVTASGDHLFTGGAYLGGFFVLTLMHALHVIGGLISLGVTLWFALRGRYSRNYYPGVRYNAIYWHFLDAVWLCVFVVIYLI